MALLRVLNTQNCLKALSMTRISISSQSTTVRKGRKLINGCHSVIKRPHHHHLPRQARDRHDRKILTTGVRFAVLERLVVNFRWPDCPNFCYVLDLDPPPDPPAIKFEVPCEVPKPVHGARNVFLAPFKIETRAVCQDRLGDKHRKS